MTLTAPPEASGASGEAPDAGLMIILRRASAMIDSMWHEAVADGGDYSTVQLAEASQGVHRALIALSALERSSLGPVS